MIVGIVGNEQIKFTPETEQKAKHFIALLVAEYDEVCSGECPLGGIDIWAHEEADAQGKPFHPFPPKTHNWSDGYKPRNLQIARKSDVVVCLAVKKLPPNYNSRWRFESCYHCCVDTHVKSGGCWTVKQAKMMGKRGWTIEI